MAPSTYIRLLLFCFSIMAYPLLTTSEQQFTTTYTKEQLKILAEKLQKEFAELPHQSFDQQCANSDEQLPDSSSNPFYQYVVNVHKEVETANDPHAFYIRNGYTFLEPWRSAGGAFCEPHLQCNKPADTSTHPIIYKCACGTTKVDCPSGRPNTNKLYPSIGVTRPDDCRYTDMVSHCSPRQRRIKCKEDTHTCLFKEFFVDCNEENEKLLDQFVKDRGLEKRCEFNDDCQCMPKTKEEPNWPTDEPEWSKKSYVLQEGKGVDDKSLRTYGVTCADVNKLIHKIRIDPKYNSGKYRIPEAAKDDFNNLRDSANVAECDPNKQLFCDIPQTGPAEYGTCKCNWTEVEGKTGWIPDVNKPTTETEHCALVSDSDCHYKGTLGNLRCHAPNKCIVPIYNTICNKDNLDAAEAKWKQEYKEENPGSGGTSQDERYVQRCHCSSPDRVYDTHQEREQAVGKPPKKRPIIDLGYGSNGCGEIGTQFSFNVWILLLPLLRMM